MVAKPDAQTMLSALLGAQLLEEAGFPPDLWQVVAGPGAEVGTAIIERADYVCFTGSTATGKLIAQQCADRLIGCSLELGGKNPILVLRDADLEKAAEGAVRASFSNAGQLCVSMERMFVADQVYDRFVERFVARTEAMTLGAGLDWGADMGSLISQDQLDTVIAPRRGRRGQGRPGAHRRPGPSRPRPVLLRADHPRGRHPRDDLLRQRDLRAGDLALPLPRRGRRGRARQRGRVRPERLDLQPGRRAGPGRSPAQIKCGTVNINEAFGATFASIDSPMGGMRESGMGRRQGSEGILRYTESQSVATQRLIRFAPDARDVRRDLRQGDDRQPAADEEAGPRMMRVDWRRFDYDVLVIGSGFGGSVTALRLTEKGYRVGVLEAGARFEDEDFADDLLRRSSGSSSRPGLGLLRHPAHRRGHATA